MDFKTKDFIRLSINPAASRLICNPLPHQYLQLCDRLISIYSDYAFTKDFLSRTILILNHSDITCILFDASMIISETDLKGRSGNANSL